MWPRSDDGTANIGLGFPVDFTIKVSADGSDWTTVASKTDYPKPTASAAQSFAFDSVRARHVRIEATKLSTDPNNTKVFQLRELEVYQTISGLTDQASADTAAAALDPGDLSALYRNLSLPRIGLEGTSIAWTSSDSSYVTDAGRIVKRPAPGEPAAALTLTATVSKGGRLQGASISRVGEAPGPRERGAGPLPDRRVLAAGLVVHQRRAVRGDEGSEYRLCAERAGLGAGFGAAEFENARSGGCSRA
ncbi:discoidin domain-containing protein [Cohnella rhizosphaerae]|uniref:Discoidin domain-containing protein n=1 Tax=Cohnella rhizosphaerae TaxID=1457232 RepID=A0A9X4L143_9BACL|nr:discoidin domain-containing protein [Cohnella rhizosphaerae]MDG0811582.1 discoidin domain-containing protein [Cohnella rhizosphaerae]